MRFDSRQVFASSRELSRQLLHAYAEASRVAVPREYRRVKQVVMAGMGGSLLGARMIEAVFGNRFPRPLVLVNNYQLPNWVGQDTLVIVSSYSGSTEETLANFRQALICKAKIMAITAGGELLSLAREYNLPVYRIEPRFNPSGQPRLAIGYSIAGQLVLAAKAGLLQLKAGQIKAWAEIMAKVKPEIAETIARRLEKFAVIITAAGHLAGAVHTVKNQMNENAKHLAHRYDLPELNHHLMEGLKFPPGNKKTQIFWLIDSGLYPLRLRQRLQLTREVIEKNGLSSITWTASAPDEAGQAFELIQLGAYVNFYLSQLHCQDPAEIPWVNYFKKRLASLP